MDMDMDIDTSPPRGLRTRRSPESSRRRNSPQISRGSPDVHEGQSSSGQTGQRTQIEASDVERLGQQQSRTRMTESRPRTRAHKRERNLFEDAKSLIYNILYHIRDRSERIARFRQEIASLSANREHDDQSDRTILLFEAAIEKQEELMRNEALFMGAPGPGRV
jgi:uncharacterized small protein (DUF1192 family)